MGARKGLQAESFQQNPQKKAIGHADTFLQTFFNNQFEQLSVPNLAVSGNLGGQVTVVDDVLSSQEQEIYPITSLGENCIDFDFQTYWNYYVDLKQT